MKTRNVLISLGVAGALAVGVGAYSFTASAQDGPGYGSGWMMGGGWGGGPGAGPWNCPAFAQNGGPGPGQSYGPGYHMRGWGGGYGPGMMRGYGPGYGPDYGPRGDVPANQTLNLTTDDVKSRVERWLASAKIHGSRSARLRRKMLTRSRPISSPRIILWSSASSSTAIPASSAATIVEKPSRQPEN